MRTVGQHKDRVAGLLTGTNLDNVTDLNGALESAARVLVQMADVPEASGRESITLYDGVTTYLAPTTIFGGALIDLRPQGDSRNAIDYVYRQPIELFDRTKHTLPNGYSVAFEHDKGVDLIRIANTRTIKRITLDTMTETTGWTLAGSGTGLAVDETVYYQSPSSLRFSMTGASVATLSKAITQIDISEYEDVAVGFLAIRTPSTTNLTSVAVRVGSSSTVYDEVSDTDGFLGAFRINEWLLVAFDFSGATSTGTPDWNAIDYIQVRVTHSGAITNFRVGGFWLSLPSPHELLFQSAAIFMASGANPAKTITSDEDQILLNDAAITLYEYESALGILLQDGGSITTGLAQNYQVKLYDPNEGLYAHYRADNPSEVLRSVGSYYD